MDSWLKQMRLDEYSESTTAPSPSTLVILTVSQYLENLSDEISGSINERHFFNSV